jgi:hypothetical protein
LGTI